MLNVVLNDLLYQYGGSIIYKEITRARSTVAVSVATLATKGCGIV